MRVLFITALKCGVLSHDFDSVNQANDDSELSCFRCYDVRNAAINHNQRNRHDDTGGI